MIILRLMLWMVLLVCTITSLAAIGAVVALAIHLASVVHPALPPIALIAIAITIITSRYFK